MNKWLIVCGILSINVVLILINVVDSADPPKPTTNLTSNTTKAPNVNSSQPTNTKSGNISKTKPRELNIKYNSGDYYTYNKNDKVETFTAKEGFSFNLIKQFKAVVPSDASPGYKREVESARSKLVWKTDDPSEYATKVVVDGKGQKVKTVTLHLVNNSTKVLHKTSSTPWEEVTSGSGDSEKESTQVVETTESTGCLDRLKNSISKMCCGSSCVSG